MPFKLSDEIVDSLLDKLSSDDKFREHFQAQPREALASLGHKPAADAAVKEGAWMCMGVGTLASKEAIKASRDTLRKQFLSAKAGYQPINLEVKKA